MHGANLAALVAASVLSLSVSAHAEESIRSLHEVDPYFQAMSEGSSFFQGVSAKFVAQAGSVEEKDDEKTRDRRFDEAVNEEIYEAIRRIKSACDSDKTRDEKIAVAETGLHDLLDTARKYLPQERRLEIGTRILLSTIEDIFYGSMIVKFDTPFKEYVEWNNVFETFVSYYKFMHNLGDRIRPQDFVEEWARDMARGLACLYD